jgi:hypothetical protein
MMRKRMTMAEAYLIEGVRKPVRASGRFLLPPPARSAG